MPTSEEGVINYVGECDAGGYLCKLCEGDCDGDSSCEGNLICAQRDGFEAVEGCSGEGGSRDVHGKDVCVHPPTSQPTPAPVSTLTDIQYVGNPCSDAYDGGQCKECTGDCDSDNDCEGELRCTQRSGSSGLVNVPGCSWNGASKQYTSTDFCKSFVMEFEYQEAVTFLFFA